MRVLVTRPRRDAEKTASALRARGHRVVISPVVEIVGTGADIGSFTGDAVLATSAHAFEHLDSAQARTIARAPLFVVGDRSARAATDAGFEPPRAVSTRASELAPEVAARIPAGSHLLYLAGRDRKPDLEEALRAAGFVVEPVVIYEARETAALTPEALEALRAGQVDAALHFSRRSAELFLRQVERLGLKHQSAAIRHVCISAEAALPFGPAAIIAATPDSKGLFAALEAV